jgi:large subunit ribosomal protein L18e
MANPIRSINPYLKQLIESLRKKSLEFKAPVWKTIAKKLQKPKRKRVGVNLSRIERNTKEGDVVVVPGVVLGSGTLSKNLTVAAWKFSTQAKEKINKSKGKCLTIKELLEKNPKGSGIKIIG